MKLSVRMPLPVHKSAALLALLGAGILASPALASGKHAPDPIEQKIRLMADALSERDAGHYEKALEKVEALLALGATDPQLQRLKAQLRDLIDHPPPPPVPHEVPALPTEFSIQPESSVLPADLASSSASTPASSASASVSTSAHATPQVGAYGMPAAPGSSLPGSPEGNASDASRHGLPSTPVVVRNTGPQAPVLSDESEVYRPLHQGDVPVTAETLLSLETARQQRLLDNAERQLRYVRQLEIEGRYAEAYAAVQSVTRELPSNPLTQSFRDRAEAVRVNLEHRVRVALLSPGVDAPRMSLDQADAPASAPRVELDLQFLEIPISLAQDLRRAWALYYEGEYSRGPASLLGPAGRELFQRPPGVLPSRRQLALIAALRRGNLHLTPAGGFPLLRLGTVGQVVLLDPSALVRELASLPECTVLGAPRWSARSGQLSTLRFSPEQATADSTPGSAEKVGWQLALTPTLEQGSDLVDLDLHPRVTRYEGYVPNGPQGTSLQASYATHELSTRVSLPKGATLVVLGPTWSDEATRSEHVTRSLPLVGPYLLYRDIARAQTTLLTFVTVRPQSP